MSQSPVPLANPAESESQQVRLSTLVLIRWFAVVGQATTLVVVQLAFDLQGWILLPLSVVAASAVLNLALMSWTSPGHRVSSGAATLHLVYDLLQLAALLYLTGGLHNPFAFFLLAPVAVAAATLSLKRTGLLVMLAVAAYSVLAVVHLPLPWPTSPINFPTLYIVGIWVALVLSTAFASFYTWRMAEEARRRAAALSATQIALANEQKVNAVGALAAAVAHEMSTPLGTIDLVAREAAREIDPDSPLGADMALIISQTERCRKILTQLGQQRDAERDATIDRVPIGALLEIIVAPHRDKNASKAVVFDNAPLPGSEAVPPPWLAQRPEIVHGLGNLVQNALQFAERQVLIETRWSAEEVRVCIVDDGPGFHQHVINNLGDPYISTRAGDGTHLGLGIFIAETLLGRTQATISFANRPGGGAAVSVVWPRRAIEAGPAESAGLEDHARLRI